MAKADSDLIVGTVLEVTFSVQSRCNHWAEVLIRNVQHTRPCHGARRENAILVIELGLLNAVRSHQDRSRKLRELAGLVCPCAAVVSRQMFISLQLWITVRRKHLSVGINLYAEPLRLLQQRIQVVQVMSRNQNRLALPGVES